MIRILPHPLTITSTVGAAGGAGAGKVAASILGPIGIAAPTAIAAMGMGKKSANFLVNAFENPMGQRLAQISKMAETDPEQAKIELLYAVDEYQQALTSKQYLGGSWGKVVKQALSNPKMWGTIGTLGSQLGIASTTTGGQAGGAVRSLNDWLAVLANAGIASVKAPGKIKLPADVNINPDGGDGAGEPGGDEIEINPDGSPKLGADGQPIKKTGGIDWNAIFKDLVIPAGLTTGLNLLGGYLQSSAAKDAAKIQSDTALEIAKMQGKTAADALALQGRMYDTSREDLMPWMNTGKQSLGRLSHLMGLEQQAPVPGAPVANFKPRPLNQVSRPGAVIDMQPTGPNQFGPKPQQGPMDFDQIAEQYRMAAEGRA